MADPQSHRPQGRVSWLGRYRLMLAGATGCLLLLGLLIFAAVHVTGVRIYTDERSIRLAVAEVEPRRVLWTGPERLGGMFTTDEHEYEPTLSTDGNELYFVRGLPGRGANIYFAERIRGDDWTEPEAVEAINSDYDDLGPRVSADGSLLLFYSNRPGGVGDSGYDIWAARRGDDGWSEPFNLGPNVNSRYNEYSPALTPDGHRLFFASDRRIAEAEGRQPMWQATIRHMGGPTGFDIFMAAIPELQPDGDDETEAPAAVPADERAQPGDTIGASPPQEQADQAEAEDATQGDTDQPAGPDKSLADLIEQLGEAEYVEALSSDYHEGACAVSPMGDFLYFSSNRPGGVGGFDIYRARLHVDGRIGKVENLGKPINSPANETDPFPAMNGFRLYFSSDREREPGHYDLFSADATEVYIDRDGRGLPTLGWSWWLLLPALLLLLALLPLLMSDSTYRKLTLMQKCVLLSLLAHLLLMVLMSAVMVGMDVIEHVWERPESTMAVDLDAAQQVEMTMQVRRQRGEVESAEHEQIEHSARGEPAQVADDAPRLTDDSPPAAAAREADSMVAIAQPDRAAPEAEPAERVEPEQPTAEVDRPEFDLPRPDHERVAEAEPDEAEPVEAAGPHAEQAARTDLPETAPQRPAETPAPMAERPEARSLAPDAAPREASPADAAEAVEPLAEAEMPDDPVEPAPVAPIERAEMAEAAEAAVDTPATAEAAAGRREPTTEPATDRADVPEASLSPEQTARRDHSTAEAPAHAPSAAEPERAVHPDAAIAMGAQAEFDPGEAPATTAEITEEAEAADPVDAEAEHQPRDRTAAADRATTEAPRPDPQLEQATDPARLAARSLASPERRDVDATTEMPTEQVELDTPATAEAPTEAFELDAPDLATEATAEADAAEAPATVEPDIVAERTRREAEAEAGPDADATEPQVEPAERRGDSLAEASQRQQRPKADVETEHVLASAMDTLSPAAVEDFTAPRAAEAPGRVDEADELTEAPAIDADRTERRRDDQVAAETDVDDRPEPAEIELEQPLARASTGLHGAAEPARRGNPHMPESLEPAGGPPPELLGDERIEPHLPTDRLARRGGETRQRLIEEFGGTPESEEAVDLALEYLAANQEPDGRWTRVTGDSEPGDRDEHQHDMGITGLTVLCFLGANHTPGHPDSQYRQTVEEGLQFLLDMQDDDGDLRGRPGQRGGRANRANMYDHAIAALALAEAALMTGDSRYREAAFKAGDFIVEAQNESTGGWRYGVGDSGDTTVLAWQTLALYSIQQLGQPIPDTTREGALRWLDDVGEDEGNILTAYRPGEKRREAPVAAQGAIARLLLADPIDAAARNRLGEHLLDHPPDGRPNYYYWYYASLTLIQFGGDAWDDWNEQVRERLIDLQVTDGRRKGSWDHSDSRWGDRGGRIYSTAMATLTLEVYYRHLPLFQQVETD